MVPDTNPREQEEAAGGSELAARSTTASGSTARGPLDAPAIVLLHGTRLSRAVWTPQLEALNDEFRVIALDLPGHGERVAERFSLDGAVEIVATAIRGAAAEGSAVVVGLSLGGYVAMTLAARYPEIVRGLVIAGASAEPVGARLVGYRALAATMDRLDGPTFDRLNRWFFRTRYPATVAEPIVAGGFWSAGGAVALRTLFNERFVPRLAAYPGPTLILNGEFDILFRLSATTFATAARNARRVVLAGAIHLSNLDRPAAFSHAVRDFARSASSP